MKKVLVFLIVVLLAVLSSCSSKNDSNGTDKNSETFETTTVAVVTTNDEVVTTNTEEDTTEVIVEPDPKEAQLPPLTLDDLKERAKGEYYIDFSNRNQNLKISARFYLQRDENGSYFADNSNPIPMIVTVENIGEEEIYQFVPFSCFDSDIYIHHHQLDVSLIDKYGNTLGDVTGEMDVHENMIAQIKLSPGEKIEFFYFLAPGKVYPGYSSSYFSEIQSDRYYKVTYGYHSSYVELFDYSESDEKIVVFSGTIAFPYKFNDNKSSANNQSVSVDVSIPVSIN